MSKLNREELLKRQSPEYLKYLKENNLEDFFVDTIKVLQNDENTTFSKYLYSPVTESDDENAGANGWKKFSNSTFHNYSQTGNFLLENSNKIADIIGENVSIFDYGVGNNVGINKTLSLIKNFKNIEEYTALDYNKNYAENAIKKVKNLYPNIKVDYFSGDFFKWTLKEEIEKPLGLCFGGTFANINEKRNFVDPENIIRKLADFRKILGDDAYFIFSQDISTIPKKLKDQYNYKICGDWFINIFNDVKIKLKTTGLKFENFKYEAEIREEECCYTHCGKTITSQKIKIGNEEIFILKNQTFDIVRSYKYSLEKFKEILNKATWNTLDTFIDKNNIAFFICKAK